MGVREIVRLNYLDLPVDVRRMVMRFVIQKSEGCYKRLIPAMGALQALDREACSEVWRVTFEKAFGRIPGADEDDNKHCPHLLGVDTWREALVRTWKELSAVPEHEKWRWEHIPLWSLKGMDARLASLGPIPAGALADLLRARGASLLRYNRNLLKSYALSYLITSINQYPAREDALIEQALDEINEGANAGCATGPFPALHRAAGGKSLRALQLVLDNGGRMLLQHAHSCGESARTPLMCAREPSIVKALLKERADPNHYITTEKGALTPLMVAARDKALPAARLLLEAGADPFVRGGRALKDAKVYEDEEPEMARLLEQHMR